MNRLFGLEGFIDYHRGWLRLGRRWVGIYKGRLQIVPLIQGGTAANTTQEDFWFRNDDGSLTTATYIGSQNSNYNPSITGDLVFRIRVIAQENNGKNDPWAFQMAAQKNGSGGYTLITTSRTDGIQYSDDANSIADGATIATADFDLTYTGTPTDGEYDDAQSAAGTGTIGLNGTYAELEFCLKIVNAQVSDADYFDLQLQNTSGGALDGYTLTPRITISKTVSHTPLTAAQGTMSFAGFAAGLTVHRTLPAAYGTLSASGQTTDLIYKRILVDIDHEDNDFSEYTGIQQDGSDLAVSAGAALAGSNYGLSVTVNDVNNIFGYVTLGTPDTSGVMRMRFYFDPNNISFATGYGNYIFDCKRVSGGSDIAEIYMLWSGSSYQLLWTLYDDGGYTYSANYNITDAPHYLELIIVRATTSSSSDGYMTLWVDGVLKETISGKDNYDTFDQLGYLKWGCTYGARSDTSGTYYIDEIIVNNSGDPIGQIVAPLTAAYGTLSFSGQTTGLLTTRLLDANNGTLSLAGQTLGLLAHRLLGLAQGSLSLTGQVTGLKKTYSLTADAGYISLSQTDTYFKLGELFHLDFEEGDLSDFDATNGNISASSGSALVGNYGANVYLDGAQGLAYGEVYLTNESDFIGIRIYIDTNTISGVDSGGFYPLYAITDDYNGWVYGLVGFQLYYASAFFIRRFLHDDSDWRFNNVQITDGKHCIEAIWKRESYDGAADGYSYWWVDGVEQTALTNVENYNYWSYLTALRVGYGRTQDTPSGNLYLDDIIVRDDGQYIGLAPVEAEQGSISLSGKDAGLTYSGAGAHTPLTADYGTLSFTGFSAGLTVSRKLTSAQGSISISGQSTGLLKHNLLSAVQGSLTFSGQVTSVYTHRLLTALYDGFSFSGFDAGLSYAGTKPPLVADYKSLTFAGQPAGIARVFSPLTADNKSLSLSGFSAGLSVTRNILCAYGTISVAGQTATFVRVYNLTAGYGSLSLAGQDILFVRTFVIVLATGLIDLSGKGVNFDYSAYIEPVVRAWKPKMRYDRLNEDDGTAKRYNRNRGKIR